jgi:hypothetical protein
MILCLDSELTGIECRAINGSTKEYESSCFDGVVSEYEKYLVKSGKAMKDVRCAVRSVARFLSNIERHGCTALSNMGAKLLYAVLTDDSIKPYRFHGTIKPFLKYAFMA